MSRPTLFGKSESRLRVFARGVWDGFSGAFRSIVRCLEAVLPPEAAWAVIYLFIWIGLVSVIVWVVGG